MVQFDELAGLRLSQLKDCKIVGTNGEQVGRLIDAAFRCTSTGIELTKFIVGGSRFEEMMERLGVKPDIDPVFETDVIDTVSPKMIKLTVSKNDLKSTHVNQDALADDELRLSEIGKLKVVDSKDEEIGKIIDLKFEDNSFKFILGDTKAREWAEAVGLIADVDFLITPESIASVKKGGVVCLDKRKDELKTTFERYISDPNAMKKAKIDSRLEASRGTIYFPGSYT